ncbi:hypothetical protein CJ030_MR6G025605 [Morella rubra]|uniref:TLC domain-containing protein n=1 Tax=Morella rubra TaxID=262757 RepID=A0A6A1VIZ2_9ROSI|nr:hypothetical protein CJ030_MR6G025605 [Morella rubra]
MEISDFSLPPLFLFFSMFFSIYIIGYFVVFRNWSPKTRPEASSCFISLAHGTPALCLAANSLLADSNRSFASPNTKQQNLVLEYSIAYFLMDLVHYIIFFPDDVLFIAHHLATLFVSLTCRYLVYHGAYAILVLLILAEITSACQNAWTLASARKNDVAFAAKLYGLLSPPFYTLYSIVRGLVGPYFVYQMCVFYGSGAAESTIPKWVWVSWIVVVVAAISASILWVSHLWVDLYRQRNRKLEKKTR